jgi:hypothetical protein
MKCQFSLLPKKLTAPIVRTRGMALLLAMIALKQKAHSPGVLELVIGPSMVAVCAFCLFFPSCTRVDNLAKLYSTPL